MFYEPDRYAYRHWAASAKKRGISVEMEFHEWRDVWLAYGGTDDGKKVLCRFGDQGPYSVDNVYVATRGQNVRDAFYFKRCRENR